MAQLQKTIKVTELERNIIELTGMGYDEYEIAELIEAIAPDEVKQRGVHQR